MILQLFIMMVCLCSNENCNEPARYGNVNEETGMFEKNIVKHINKLVKRKPPAMEKPI